MATHLYSGMNLRSALEIARSLGCRIAPVNGTGEIRISHFCMLQAVTTNARRKDCERKLTCWLRELARKLNFLHSKPRTP
jgi:hypothetical protein